MKPFPVIIFFVGFSGQASPFLCDRSVSVCRCAFPGTAGRQSNPDEDAVWVMMLLPCASLVQPPPAGVFSLLCWCTPGPRQARGAHPWLLASPPALRGLLGLFPIGINQSDPRAAAGFIAIYKPAKPIRKNTTGGTSVFFRILETFCPKRRSGARGVKSSRT